MEKQQKENKKIMTDEKIIRDWKADMELQLEEMVNQLATMMLSKPFNM